MIEQIGKVTARSTGEDRWAPIDARIYYDVDTHDWHDALKVQPPSGSPFQENFDVYWIHAIAAARLGDGRQAEKELENFRNSSGEWIKGHAWTESILHPALIQAEAWTLFSQGKQDEAVQKLRTAVQFELDLPIYYADVLARPSSEMLGDMFLQMGKPAEALSAYKVSLEMAPNRFDSLSGAEASASSMGNKKLSNVYAKKIASLRAVVSR